MTQLTHTRMASMHDIDTIRWILKQNLISAERPLGRLCLYAVHLWEQRMDHSHVYDMVEVIKESQGFQALASRYCAAMEDIEENQARMDNARGKRY